MSIPWNRRSNRVEGVMKYELLYCLPAPNDMRTVYTVPDGAIFVGRSDKYGSETLLFLVPVTV